MWPRVAEMALGLWLAVSPAVLPGAGGDPVAWAINGTVGGVVFTIAAACFHPRRRHAHAATLVVALALLAWGWAQLPHPGPPLAQNQILVGLLLLLTAVIPTEAARPPAAWRTYVEETERAG